MGSQERTGRFNYLAGSVEPSLYRSGRVLTRRDPDGSDSGTEGVVIEKCEVPVQDARCLVGKARRTVASTCTRPPCYRGQTTLAPTPMPTAAG